MSTLLNFRYKLTLNYVKGQQVSTKVVNRKVMSGQPPSLALRVKSNVNPNEKVVVTAVVKSTLATTKLVWSCASPDEEGMETSIHVRTFRWSKQAGRGKP